MLTKKNFSKSKLENFPIYFVLVFGAKNHFPAIIINLKTNEKIKYYRFRVEGLNKMKINGIGGGDAKNSGFIEINNSSRSLDRKKLVLKIMIFL